MNPEKERDILESRLNRIWEHLVRTPDDRAKHQYVDKIISLNKEYRKKYGLHFVPKQYQDRIFRG